jgi:hypothetical protein
MSSGLPLIADITRCSRHFAFVPKPEVHIARETVSYGGNLGTCRDNISQVSSRDFRTAPQQANTSGIVRQRTDAIQLRDNKVGRGEGVYDYANNGNSFSA